MIVIPTPVFEEIETPCSSPGNMEDYLYSYGMSDVAMAIKELVRCSLEVATMTEIRHGKSIEAKTCIIRNEESIASP